MFATHAFDFRCNVDEESQITTSLVSTWQRKTSVNIRWRRQFRYCHNQTPRLWTYTSIMKKKKNSQCLLSFENPSAQKEKIIGNLSMDTDEDHNILPKCCFYLINSQTTGQAMTILSFKIKLLCKMFQFYVVFIVLCWGPLQL